VGFGHLMDARRLAERLGYDKNRWVDLKEVLPLLSQRKYYKDLRYGYARGREPVHYVENIRDYLDILERRFPVANPLSRAGTTLTPWSLNTLAEAGLIDPLSEEIPVAAPEMPDGTAEIPVGIAGRDLVPAYEARADQGAGGNPVPAAGDQTDGDASDNANGETRGAAGGEASGAALARPVPADRS
jgi:hypothetical protein